MREIRVGENDVNLFLPVPSVPTKTKLSALQRRRFHRCLPFLPRLVSSPAPSPSPQLTSCISCHSYFINISVLRILISLSLLPASLLSLAGSHNKRRKKKSKGALTPIIKELLKLALIGLLVAAVCQQRISHRFDCVRFLFTQLNSALILITYFIAQVNTT